MNFFKLHIGDYESATAHLSWEEDAAYNRLMRVYYRRQAGIPDADKYRLIRATKVIHRQACDRVLKEFFTLNSSLWINKRCEEEIAAYLEQSETNRKNATNQRHSTKRIASESLTNGTPNHKPLTRTANQKPEKIFKPDLEVSISPTRRKEVKVKNVLKKFPEEQNQEQLEKNRRIGIALANGNVKLAKAIKAGRA